MYATIGTPRGGQYQITLADGTKVWPNVASKLTYPSHFIDGSREVELAGAGFCMALRHSVLNREK